LVFVQTLKHSVARYQQSVSSKYNTFIIILIIPIINFILFLPLLLLLLLLFIIILFILFYYYLLLLLLLSLSLLLLLLLLFFYYSYYYCFIVCAIFLGNGYVFFILLYIVWLLGYCWTMIQSFDYDWISIFHVMNCMYSAWDSLELVSKS